MITSFSVPIYSQRDPRWSGQRLGTVNGATIGQYGCLITSISMMNAGFDPNNPLTPNQIDDLFTNNGGYANGDLVVWNKINALLPNCATMGQDFCANTPAPIDKIKHHLDIGGLVVVQVGFGGNPANMHYLLVVGYGAGPIFNDPWYGDQSNFESRRYGTGDASKDILAVHYFGDAIANEPVKPAVPVATRPASQPLLGFQRTVRAGVNVNYRKTQHQDGEVIKLYHAGDILDFKGFVTDGDNVDGNSTWFVGKYSGGYAFSGAFEDTGTHDLEDLTPAPPQLEPTPAPPTPEPVATLEPAPEPEASPQAPVENPEYIATWVPDNTIPPQIIAVPSADVLDVTEDKVVTTLKGGELLKPLGGYFQYKGISYVRTQQSVEKDRWWGISQSEIKPYDAPSQIENTAVPFDSITATPKDTGLINFEEPKPEVTQQDEVKLEEALRALGETLLGLASTPLRLVAVLNKLLNRR